MRTTISIVHVVSVNILPFWAWRLTEIQKSPMLWSLRLETHLTDPVIESTVHTGVLPHHLSLDISYLLSRDWDIAARNAPSQLKWSLMNDLFYWI